jgi:hypothetical protein
MKYGVCFAFLAMHINSGTVPTSFESVSINGFDPSKALALPNAR